LLGKNVGPSHELSDIDVQKLTMNSALQLYAVLLLLPDLRCGVLILNFCDTVYSATKAKECLAAPRKHLHVATRHKEAHQARKCCTAMRHSLTRGLPFVEAPGPCWANILTCSNPHLLILGDLKHLAIMQQ